MGFFDLIEQNDRVWVLHHRIGEQTALIKTDVARRCTNQSRYSVPFHVLGHIKANQLDTHDLCELLGHLGLTDTGGACKHEATYGLVLRAKART